MKNRGGFTIIETLIVLSVSSIIFATVIVTFASRQKRVEFSQGLRDIESYIQDVANDVRNGYYDNIPDKKCTYDGTKIEFVSSNVPITQGTSSVCIFAGKSMLFNSYSTPGSITTTPLAGLKNATDLPSLKLNLMGISGSEVAKDYTIPSDIYLVKGDSTKISVLLSLIFDVNSVGVESTSTKKISNVLPYITQINSTDVNPAEVRAKLADSTTLSPITTSNVNLCFSNGNQVGNISLNKGPDGLTTSLQIGKPLVSVGCYGV